MLTWLAVATRRLRRWAGLIALSGCASEETERQPPPAALMRAPFSVSHLNFFHSALEIPVLESAQVLVDGETQLQFRTALADSNDEGTSEGQPQNFEGRFDQWMVADMSWGLDDGLELGGRLKIGGWAEHVDTFTLLDADGNAIVTGEQELVSGLGASERHMGLTDVVLHARQLFDRDADSALAGLVSLKIPAASKRDLSNAGTYDVNAGLQRSSVDGNRTLHLNAGVGVPLGDQNLFIESANVDLDPWLYAGIGLNWLIEEDLSWGVQLEGNTGAFGDVDFLDGTPLTVIAGVRKAVGDWALDFGAGTGLTDQSYRWLASVGVTRRY